MRKKIKKIKKYLNLIKFYIFLKVFFLWKMYIFSDNFIVFNFLFLRKIKNNNLKVCMKKKIFKIF